METALETAYREFVFVTAEVENRTEVASHADQLREDMLEPAAMKLCIGESGYSERRDVSSILKKIASEHPIDDGSSPTAVLPKRGMSV